AQAATVSFEYYQRLIFLKVTVNGSDSLLFLFDTGANTSAIDEKVAETLQLTTIKVDSIEGTAGIIVVPTVKAKKVAVGNAIVKNIYFTKYDLSGSLAPPNKHLAGILGTDFLKHFAVTIDFQSNQLSFSRSPGEKLPWSFSFEMDNGIPRVKSVINDSIPVYFRYDSGSSLFETKDIYLNTTTAVLELLMKIDTSQKPVKQFSATGVGGNIKIPVYKITSVLLSNQKIEHPFLIIQPRQGYFARNDAVGFFGNNLMEKFEKVTIDFIRKKMYVRHQSLSAKADNKRYYNLYSYQ
ncbi:MAG: TIGR02281 family clan AA aspartic protease, partial [Methanococcaceae archaeon]